MEGFDWITGARAHKTKNKIIATHLLFRMQCVRKKQHFHSMSTFVRIIGIRSTNSTHKLREQIKFNTTIFENNDTLYKDKSTDCHLAILFLSRTNSVRDRTVPTNKFVWTLEVILNPELEIGFKAKDCRHCASLFFFSHSYQHIIDDVYGNYLMTKLNITINESVIIYSKPCQCFHEFFTKSYLA